MIEYLNWDSDFFGYRIGKINISQLNNFSTISEVIEKVNYKLIYLVIDEEFHTLSLQKELEEANIRLVDEKVTFQQEISSNYTINTSSDDIQLYLSELTTSKLIDLSLQSGVYSRFLVDENFVNDEYKKLYTAWVQNSVNGSIADKVIVAKREDQIIGLLTLSFKNIFSDIGILAVDSDYRGQRIGKKLIKRVIIETKKKSLAQIKVVTQQRNSKACNFYIKQNFRPEKLEYIYHIWL